MSDESRTEAMTDFRLPGRAFVSGNRGAPDGAPDRASELMARLRIISAGGRKLVDSCDSPIAGKPDFRRALL
jgi:hypothetical protein